MTAIFTSKRTVRFQDIDAAGIIFFAKVFEYFHDTFVDCLQNHGVELPKVLQSGAWLAPLVHSEADYKKPMRFGDEVFVDISEAQLKEKSMIISYTIRSCSSDDILATGKTAHVFLERASMRPRAIPEEIKTVFRVPHE